MKNLLEVTKINFPNFISLIRRYPIPVFAIFGLFVGSISHWILNDPDFGHLVWLVVVVMGGIPIIWDTIKGILHRKFAADIVAMLAILVSIITNDPFPGVIIVLMQSGGKALEDYAFYHAQDSLKELLKRSPRFAIRKNEGIQNEIDVNDVKPGDLLVVRTGDLIPVDGITKNDQIEIDESLVTGEPLSKIKKINEIVLSGTVNVGDTFEMEAQKTSGESQYAKIVQIVRKAQQEKAPIQRLADKFAVWFTPIVIVVSLLGWLITQNTTTILAVLVVATPCPLIFATPTGIISGINRAAKNGIVVKTGTAIEQLGKAKAIFFDKTGTITYGIPKLEYLKPIGNIEPDILLRNLAGIEQMSSHPAAKSVLILAEGKFGKLPNPENFHELPGAGVEGDIEGQHIMVGSENVFLKMNSKLREDIQNAKTQIDSNRKMLAYVTINGNLSGILIFSDLIRPDVESMIHRLNDLGIKKAAMLTGDNLKNANNIAAKAGISTVHANLLPEQKVDIVKKAKEQYGNIIMVGDGINDAPSLATATTGIAMGYGGTAISAATSDIVLLVDDITKVTTAVEISQHTTKIVKQGIIFGIGASFVLMGFASLGYISPGYGALFQEILDVTVILNALRAR
jgi:heavy metal translocating P-type ATPase